MHKTNKIKTIGLTIAAAATAFTMASAPAANAVEQRLGGVVGCDASGKKHKGVLKASRSNGDVLYYDPRGNVFVVADRQGAPRTMFKPEDGMSYWTEQTQRLASEQTSQRTSGERRQGRGRNGGDDSNG